jgi:hypothetical protein
MQKEKRNWPWTSQTIWVENRLPNKAVHVIITPNQDYVLAELLVGFVGLGSGALGIVKTASDLVRVLRLLSLMRNAKDIIDKLKNVIPKSAITIRPNQRMEAHNGWFSDPDRFLKPLSTLAEMFGGKTRTITITDEDFKNTVQFDTEVDKQYFVNETGVDPPMHYWNGGYMVSGLLSSAPPSLIRMEQMLMAYRDTKGDRIYLAELKDGFWNHKDRGWINSDAKQGIGVTSMKGNLCLVARDHKGDQMFSLWEPDQTIPFDAGRTWMGPDIQGKPSATTIGDTTYAVAKHYPGNAVMWAIRRADGHIEWGNTNLNTAYSPSIHAYKGKLYLFFSRMDTKRICVAVSDNGSDWSEVRNDLAPTSAGVALTVYKDRLYVFYRDEGDHNGVFYMWTTDGSRFQEPSNRYFGFDVAGEPTASPMPGDNGIMVAGILTAKWRITDLWDVPENEAMIWTILMPWEPPTAIVPVKTVKPRRVSAKKAAKKAAKKSTSKTAAAKKKPMSAKPAKKASSRKPPTTGAKRKK